MRNAKQSVKEGGFTIVELMIALSVLAVLLVTATVILIQIGSLYSKGVNGANLQNTTRNVVADISGQLQFSATPPNGCTPTPETCFAAQSEQTYSYCIGHTRYSYILKRELGTDSSTDTVTPHVLWRDTMKTEVTACNPLDLSVEHPSDADSVDDSGYEMLGNHMRLIRFKVEKSPTSTTSSSVYDVSVWTGFGDEDLFDFSGSLPVCKGSAGTQFCGTSLIDTQLTGRKY